MPAPDTQKELDGLQKLDAQTIGAVYDQYFSEIYRYVRYRLGDSTPVMCLFVYWKPSKMDSLRKQV